MEQWDIPASQEFIESNEMIDLAAVLEYLELLSTDCRDMMIAKNIFL